jgi:hypothetical protein
VSHAGADGNTFNISVGRNEGKNVTGKPGRKSDDNTEIDLKGIRRLGVK